MSVLVYCLVVLAIVLAGIAAARRYSQKRLPGETASEPGDIAERQMDALMPALGFTGGMQAVHLPSPRSEAMSQFVCPQCQSCFWTHAWRGRPACPFCGREMTRQGLGVSLAGWAPAPHAPSSGVGPRGAIPTGADRHHGDRCAGNYCQTTTPLSASSPALTLAGSWRCPPGAYWQGAAATTAPSAADTVGLVLVRQFGMEVCPAPGSGVQVSGVMANSRASSAGLRAGDIVIGFNGSSVGGLDQFQRMASRAVPETDAQIKILRNGRTRDLLIMVGEGEMEGVGPVLRP